MTWTRLAGRPDLATEAPAAAAYLERVHDAFLEAVRASTPVPPQRFRIGPELVEVQLASPSLLVPLTGALDHLRTEDPGAPGLTICAWDSESSGVELPEPPWGVAGLIARREPWGLRGPPVRAMYEFAGGPRLSLLDVERGLAILWMPGARSVAWYERAAPFQRPLHWWLRTRGLQLTHAAVVGRRGGDGVLLGGRGGSGKSTTTLACLSAGLGWAGDDHILLAGSAPPVAYSLYGAAKLAPPHLARMLPELSPAASDGLAPGQEKAVVEPERVYPGRLLRRVPIRAVALPVVRGGRSSRLVEISPAAAIAAIVPSTLLQLRWTEPEEYEAIAAAVKSVPSYRLELGTDLRGVADAVAGLLAD